MSLKRERSSDDPILKKQMDLKKLNADNSVFHMMRSENMQLNLDLSWLARSTDVDLLPNDGWAPALQTLVQTANGLDKRTPWTKISMALPCHLSRD